MNPRIKELSLKASASVPDNVSAEHAMYVFQKKFAELIILDVVETLGTYENTWTHEEQMNLLKKDFGVEA